MKRIFIACLWLLFSTAAALHADEPAPVLGAHGLRLPASFTGTLPCADCAGIAHHLDLWPNQIYHMRRVWEGRDPAFTRDEVGRWHADPARGALVLTGASEAPIFWQVMGPDRLRQMDLEGNPIDSDLPLDLISLGALQETDLSLPLQGLFLYLADAASFEICLTGERFPVSMEGDYLALERAYLAERSEPGVPMMAVLDGTLTVRPVMEGPPRRSVVVNRLDRLETVSSCDRHRAPAHLENTYWRILRLDGVEIAAKPDHREPHLLLQAGPTPGYSATVGCNQLGGGFTRDDTDGLRFSPGFSTLMACGDPIDGWEQKLSSILADIRHWAIAGQSLTLRDESGAVRAVLEAVYLP
ncbi:MAG: META domain-containing protein [Rhodobacteraceae bacterium]|nr:META domain-containing protein [Paracoccaceae bacterium]